MTNSSPTHELNDRPVLVTGATGFIGLEVVKVLVDQGIPVRAMFRRRHRAALLAQLDTELVFANLLDQASLCRATQGCRAIIHLGGRATFERYDRLRPTLVDGTKALVQAAEDTGVERIAFGSSLFVHGPEDGPVVDVASRCRPLLDYGRAKVEAESVLADSALSTVALRLPHVYGWNDILFGIARSGFIPFPADMDTSFPHLHVTDAARFLAAAVATDGPAASLTGAIPIADDETVTWRHFFEVMTSYFPRLRVVPLPASPIRFALEVIERMPAHKPSMLAADTIRGWNMNLEVDRDSSAVLGLRCHFRSVHTGIPAVLDSARPYRWRHPVFDRTAA